MDSLGDNLLHIICHLSTLDLYGLIKTCVGFHRFSKTSLFRMALVSGLVDSCDLFNSKYDTDQLGLIRQRWELTHFQSPLTKKEISIYFNGGVIGKLYLSWNGHVSCASLTDRQALNIGAVKDKYIVNICGWYDCYLFLTMEGGIILIRTGENKEDARINDYIFDSISKLTDIIDIHIWSDSLWVLRKHGIVNNFSPDINEIIDINLNISAIQLEVGISEQFLLDANGIVYIFDQVWNAAMNRYIHTVVKIDIFEPILQIAALGWNTFFLCRNGKIYHLYNGKIYHLYKDRYDNKFPKLQSGISNIIQIAILQSCQSAVAMFLDRDGSIYKAHLNEENIVFEYFKFQNIIKISENGKIYDNKGNCLDITNIQ